MEYFNSNAFLLGTLALGCFYGSSLVTALLCIFSNIKIVELDLFFSPLFSFYQKKINNTLFTLGWLPTGSSIKLLGVTPESFEDDQITEVDFRYTYFFKSKALKVFIQLSKWIFLTTLFCLLVIFYFDQTDIFTAFNTIADYILLALKAMFDNNSFRSQFIEATQTITVNKSILHFSFILFVLFFHLAILIDLILKWTFNSLANIPFFRKFIGVPLLLGILWLMVWKVPTFTFSFFSHTQSILYSINFINGLYTAGIICFFATLLIVKTNRISFYENRLDEK